MRKLTGLFLFTILFSFSLQARVLVISDIDDTIKQANNMSKIGVIFRAASKKIFVAKKLIYHDLKKQAETNGEEIEFAYVTAAPKILLRSDKWPQKRGFPEGQTYERKSVFDSTFAHKYTTIMAIIENNQEKLKEGEQLTVYMFGDNSSHDHNVYWQVNEDTEINAKIYIRDVATKATDWGTEELEVMKINNVKFFLSEVELLQDENLTAMSEGTKQYIQSQHDKGKLLPKYIGKTLKKRLRKLRKCIQQEYLNLTIKCYRKAKKDSKKFLKTHQAKFQTQS